MEKFNKTMYERRKEKRGEVIQPPLIKFDEKQYRLDKANDMFRVYVSGPPVPFPGIGKGVKGGAVALHRHAQVQEQNRREQLNIGERRLEDEANLEPIDKLYDAILDEANFTPNDINRKLLKKKLNVKPLKSKWMVYESNWMWILDTKVFGRDVISNGEVGLLVCVDASTRR